MGTLARNGLLTPLGILQELLSFYAVKSFEIYASIFCNSVFNDEGRGVFRTLSNIYDDAF